MEPYDYIIEHLKIGHIKYALIELYKLDLISAEIFFKDYAINKEYFNE